ncbi:MAG: phosphoglucosamine mutase [Atribacterota bacterium]|nr:phosphoglucosamine mutase [Atribacterota bacterium]
MMTKLFGTDGIRGLANQYPMNAEVAFQLGRAIGYYIRHKKNKNVLIAKDTRISGDMLGAALTAGLCSTGCNVLEAGIITTPAVGYLTKYYQAIMGVVISASHNPYYDNGIKLFQGNGFKLDHQEEQKIEKILLQEKYKRINITGKNIGKVIRLKEANEIYLQYIINSIPPEFQKPEYKIVIDCANGASSYIISELFTRQNIDFKIINNSPNGININQRCGSTCIKNLQKEVLKEHADLGFAFDGDADRVLAVDEKGQLIDGDQIMFIYTNAFIKEGRLGNNIIVTTHMSNLGFDETIRELGGRVIRTDIGDKYVLKKMIAVKALLGGEQSGHIIFLLYGPNGDGLLTSFQFLDALSRSKERISAQASRMKKYYQRLLNYKIINKNYFLKSQYFEKMKKEIEDKLKNNGRTLIRFSGTENKLRILLESKEKRVIADCQKIIDEFMATLKSSGA